MYNTGHTEYMIHVSVQYDAVARIIIILYHYRGIQSYIDGLHERIILPSIPYNILYHKMYLIL